MTINQSGDIFEQEADRIADQVLAAPTHPAVNDSSLRIQRFSGQSGGQLNGQMEAAPASVDQTLTSPGRPLEPALREDMEQRFGHNFADVRVYSDAGAQQSARDVNAQAYTVGHNIVFGAGRFAPETNEGRHLLAHELTHVVQQSGNAGTSVDQSDKRSLSSLPGQRIQRRLLVTGKHPDIQALFDLLEPASGFTLKYDPKTKEVSINASRLRPASPVLAGRLATIMDDPVQDAELNLGRSQQGVSFGKFPESGPLIQEINIDNLARLEVSAPGSGVAYIAHEIVENYHAHSPSLQGVPRMDPGGVFEESHEEGLEAERLVAGDLIGPGGRVAEAVVDKGHDMIRWVRDYEQYFLVYDRDLRTGVLTYARQAPRINVATYVIGGFAAGSLDLPAAVKPTIEAVAGDMRMNRAATVRIQVGGPDSKLALRRAVAVQDAILDNGKSRNLYGFDLRSDKNFNLVVTGSMTEQVVITVDQPDTEVESLRGGIVKRWLPSQSQRPILQKGNPDWRPRR
ncbi:MAG: DUF4157 domain-containing protein [Acidobacteriota bacterium]